MAARPPKPPGLTTTTTTNNQLDLLNFEENNCNISELKQEKSIEIDKINEENFKCLKLKKTNCICTNISIMHLFHEMKQKFPTVPDHIVNQCVIDNCHDRENCIKLLKNELALHPTTAQSYPSTLLLRNNQNINNNLNENCKNINNINNKPLKPTRPAPVPKFNLINNCDTQTRNFINLKPIQKNQIKSPTQRKSNLNNKIILNDIKLKNQIGNLKKSTPSVVINQENNCNKIVNLENNIPIISFQQQQQQQQKTHQPQRPTTLNFHEPKQKFVNQQQQQVHRPVRKAPPPPVGAKVYTSTTPTTICSPPPAASSSAGQLHTTNSHNFDQSFSSTTSIQSPLSFSDSGESEISVNISLSPSSDRSRQQQQPNRRISSLTLQPEPPYTRDFIQQNPRSFTSLNLTLRKPSTIPQSPIDITAGPGLTYSSSSYDPRRGYQKNFHITVTDQGGMFSASRIRPRSCFVSSVQHPEEEFHDLAGQVNLLRPASSELNVIGSDSNNIYVDEQKITPLCQQLSIPNVCLQIIERQKSQKDQLIIAIEKNKKRLEHIQQEIKILKMPEYPGLSERLDMEIDKLRCNCEDLLNEIDKAKQLGQIETNNEISLPYRQNRPPRPPLPRVLTANTQYQRHLQQQQQHQKQISSPLNEQQQQHHQQQQQQEINNSADEDGPQWSCKYCTFLNDPLMIRCEKCDNIREIPGTFNNNNNNLLTNSRTNNTINNSSTTFINNDLVI